MNVRVATQGTATTTNKQLAWGILGTGAIARQFADALTKSKRGSLAAVATRKLAGPPADSFRGARLHEGYDALLADPAVDAVYIATPHPTHAELAIRAVEAGKHVLCEKPLAMNAPEAMAVADAAERHGVVLMEAFMYRSHPQTRKLIEIVKSGELGEITLIQASYGYRTDFLATKRHFDPKQGGGAILDVGCYGVSMARLIAGAVGCKPVEEPLEVEGQAHFGEAGIDERATAILRFPNDLLAQISVSMTTVQDNRVRIFGSAGRLEVMSPWFCSGKTGGVGILELTSAKGEKKSIEVATDDWLYAIEADAFADAVAAGAAAWPAMTLSDTIGNMRVLDAWRAAIGLEYPCERPERRVTVSGHALRKPDATNMVYDDRLGLGKRTSRIVTGGMAYKTYPLAAVGYDTFFEAGGTVFDTAYVYGQGSVDRLLGQWLASRGVRDEMVIIGKGAHTPHCRPEAVRPQLMESLERLKTDYIDLYFLHRDDPAIPVGEFVDVLDALVSEGRIRKFGGSNWTIARIEAGNAYAAEHGRRGFELLSNNFSLAEMVAPMWPGCISASDDASAAWLQRTQTPLFAWSSQARGFFTDRAGRDKYDDPQLVQSWYSETNFARRDRVRQLAAQRGVSPAQVALAYLLVQPFPIYPIIGPATVAELRDSLGALDVKLTPADAAWLKTGRGNQG